MLAYVYHILNTFRKVFTRRATWPTFCVVVLGFLGVDSDPPCAGLS